jgi:hypothetical protein
MKRKFQESAVLAYYDRFDWLMGITAKAGFPFLTDAEVNNVFKTICAKFYNAAALDNGSLSMQSGGAVMARIGL